MVSGLLMDGHLYGQLDNTGATGTDMVLLKVLSTSLIISKEPPIILGLDIYHYLTHYFW